MDRKKCPEEEGKCNWDDSKGCYQPRSQAERNEQRSGSALQDGCGTAHGSNVTSCRIDTECRWSEERKLCYKLEAAAEDMDGCFFRFGKSEAKCRLNKAKCTWDPGKGCRKLPDDRCYRWAGMDEAKCEGVADCEFYADKGCLESERGMEEKSWCWSTAGMDREACLRQDGACTWHPEEGCFDTEWLEEDGRENYSEAVVQCSADKFGINFCSDWCNVRGKWGCHPATLEGSDPRNTDNVDYSCSCLGCNGCGEAVEQCSADKFGINFCSDWCNVQGKWGCHQATLEGPDPRNTDNVDYTCSCSGCNGCGEDSSNTLLFLAVALGVTTALGFVLASVICCLWRRLRMLGAKLAAANDLALQAPAVMTVGQTIGVVGTPVDAEGNKLPV
eukprot:TRINITY_DN10863_c0_g2_i4.p1 TRINITY_DN10863_c0_g2~~TRINITY_DN10863_c0_g2_i4.p1  ORF type:complete len:435 (+),score=75.21 TRINITY_DN10863_c0_g2_i4:143-1306(+)